MDINLQHPASPSNSSNNNNNHKGWRFFVILCSVITFSAGAGAGLTLRSFYTSINQEHYGVSCDKQQQLQQKSVVESSRSESNNNNNDMLQMQHSTSRENMSVSEVEQEWQSMTGSNSVMKKGRDGWSDSSNNNGSNNIKNNTSKEGSATSTTTAAATSSSSAAAAATSAWCPTAVCQNSDLCHPCKRRFLIVIASGRSASTTLTYMLDSLPGVRMSGENNDTLKAIRRMINNVAMSENFIRGTNEKTAWGHYKVPDGAFACVAQHMMETINPPETDASGKLLVHGQDDDDDDDSETIVGFKTIRLLENLEQGEKLENLIRWVQESFPCARVVVNIRSNVQEQVESWKKTLNVDTDLEQLKAKNELYMQTSILFGKQAYFLDSSDWLKDISHFNRLVKWLGFNEDCFFDEPLEFNTKGSGYAAGRTEAHHNPNCRYVGGGGSGSGTGN